MKNTLLTIASLFIAATAFCQKADNAYSLSMCSYQGTAKSLAMGNALGAVGGDMTSICTNPAGMGIYRSNEITASLGFTNNLSESSYYGNVESPYQKSGMNIPNIGLVIASQKSNYSRVRYTQFGIGLTRTNDFNTLSFASGINPSSSLIDDFIGQIPDGYDPRYFREDYPNTLYPAWRLYLIDTINGMFGSPVPQGQLNQSRKNSKKGRSEEWTFSYSANFSERVFIGASFGLTHIKRMTTSIHTEKPLQETASSVSRWNFTENTTTEGWGFNLKIGAIIFPASWCRFGISYHTPTLYSLDESWKTITDVTFRPNSYDEYTSPVSNYEYEFKSPQKATASMAFIINQQGIISIDIDAINYGRSAFDDENYDYSSLNAEISKTYGRTYNFRIGTEWQYNYVYFRGGCAYYGSPYHFGDENCSIKKASCGIGVQVSEGVFFDFAYELSHSKASYTLYSYEDIQPVEETVNRSGFIATMKLKF